MRIRPAAITTSLLACLAPACSEPRPSQLGEVRCPTFSPDIAKALGPCLPCHSGSSPAGDYRLGSYSALVSRQDDGTARVVPGDRESSLLAAVRGERPGHDALPAPARAVLEDWVVRCRLPPTRYRIHENGWMNPGDREAFHGAVLRRAAYDDAPCRRCHGDDPRGSPSGVACKTCHASGLSGCSTCHGDASSAAPPRDLSGLRATSSLGVGAHRTHLSNGTGHQAVRCEVCHLVPSVASADGHFRRGDATDDGPAEVRLPSAKGATASWDRTSATCTGTACHAPTRDSRATRQAPRWPSVGTNEAACGTCHGLPPEGHADERCEVCHSQVLSGGKFVRPDLHVNGAVEVGDGREGCLGCHGSGTSSAPPRDLLGRTDETLPGTGAHRAHLEARHRLRGPIACEECHLVPKDVSDPGHIDSAAPAEVFPDVTGVSALARSDGATPVYAPGASTCASVYCHGGGVRASRDAATGLIRTPSWTGGPSQARCGSCHGVPPKDAAHTVEMGLSQCASCHGETIGPNGNLKVERDPASGVLKSTHLDGKVQVSR
jgi:predicted CxxxxCH...CXXCH cytochrome family protein